MISLYHRADSIIHRVPAGAKLLALVGLSSGLFIFDNVWAASGAVGIVLVLYAIAQIPLKVAFSQIKPVLYLLVLFFVAQGFFVGWDVAVLIVARFAALILAAGLITLTTLTSNMVGAIEAGLRPFSRWIAVDKVSLALSLAIRFIPVVATLTTEVREAQRVRGLESNIFAIAMPVIIRTLKMGTQIAEALDARSFGASD
ncbi:MAG: energy-coupling factor transporter transmembrane protein EcfT [Sneathiella sp.]